MAESTCSARARDSASSLEAVFDFRRAGGFEEVSDAMLWPVVGFPRYLLYKLFSVSADTRVLQRFTGYAIRVDNEREVTDSSSQVKSGFEGSVRGDCGFHGGAGLHSNFLRS